MKNMGLAWFQKKELFKPVKTKHIIMLVNYKLSKHGAMWSQQMWLTSFDYTILPSSCRSSHDTNPQPIGQER